MSNLIWTEEADDFLIFHALAGKKQRWIANEICVRFGLNVSEKLASKRIISLLDNGADQRDDDYFDLHSSQSDAAHTWGFNAASLRRYINDGLLPCVRDGQSVKIDIVAMDILAECRKLKGIDWDRFKSEMEELSCV